MPISEYDGGMARAATTSDVFNAIAEPQRREILMLLRAGERPVTEVARELGMAQPGASKHLRVLREVGLVRDRSEEHTSELQSHVNLVCRLLLEQKKAQEYDDM